LIQRANFTKCLRVFGNFSKIPHKFRIWEELL